MKNTIFLIFTLFVLLSSCKSKTTTNQDVTKNDNWEKEYVEKGKEIASSSFIALSGALSKAVKNGGIESALSFCNVNAIPLTDSLSKAYNVEIKRTSLKYRNKQNKPTSKEKLVLQEYNRAKESEQVMKPMIIEENGNKVFHAPIIVQDACLKCHGDIASISVYDKILKLYPEDMATGYTRGDLRGMWSVTFKK